MRRDAPRKPVAVAARKSDGLRNSLVIGAVLILPAALLLLLISP